MIRGVVKKTYYRALDASGAWQRRAERLRRENKVVILNLHSVSPLGSDYWPPMRPEVFEALLKFLSKHFEVRSIDDIQAVDPVKPIAILSFDDGYYDFIEFALPLLRKYNIRANMNVIPECVLSGQPMWNVRLYDFLSTASRKTINEIKIPGFSHSLLSETPRGKVEFGLRISKHLKSKPRGQREEIWQSIAPYVESAGLRKTRMMNLEEVRQIAEFADIGAHSYSHESMGLEDADFFERDVERCREFFREELSTELRTYAFPNGSYRSEQIQYLRETGIEKILLVDEKFADSGTDVLPRITMYGETEREVTMKALNF